MNKYQKEAFIEMIEYAIGSEKLTHFAKRAGLSAGNLSRIRKGQPATPDTLRKIANASDKVTYFDLLKVAGFSEEDELRDPVLPSVSMGSIRIPVVKELDRSKEELLLDDTLECECYYNFPYGDGNFIYFIPNDDAIVPLGSRVLIDLDKTPSDGDAVLFLLDGKETMLRHLTKSDRTYLYYGDDMKKYPMISVKKSRITVYGVAVQANIYF